MPESFAITRIAGKSGRLRDGSRPLTMLKKWEATATDRPNGVWRMDVADHIPHPLNWQDFDVGRELTVSVETVGGTHTGAARVLTLEPLTLEIKEMHRAE